jgi:rfaE bifunctional protein nucleotidyltransferase chain/domain
VFLDNLDAHKNQGIAGMTRRPLMWPDSVEARGPILMGWTRNNTSWALDELMAVRAEYRQAERTVAWTNGCFDLLHAGHVRSLQAAAALADVLIVGVNSDASVRRLKGPGRPILPQEDRVALLAALECVDHVVVFEEDTPEAILELLKPDIHLKGADYAPPHGKPIPERAIVERYGGRVVFLPLVEGISTSEIIRRVRALPPALCNGSLGGRMEAESLDHP